MNEIIMSAKFPSRCTDCGHKINAGDLIKFHTGIKAAKHVKCHEDSTEQAKVFEMLVKASQNMEVK
jgi:DNA-directed RNA polymerase subunit RPC12/RpoP